MYLQHGLRNCIRGKADHVLNIKSCPYLVQVQVQSIHSPCRHIPLSRSFVIEMNLLKRLFSLGGKKNKKKRAQIVHNVPLPEHDLSGLQANDDLEHEAAVGRLLRSSSARYVETPEPDYATLSPLRKDIDPAIW